LIVNVYNKGDVETGMRIVFRAKGALTNPSLFNVETREFIKINKAMTAGEVITIDTNYGKKGITLRKNGVESNILNYIDIAGGGNTFLQLAVGDNLLRYNADTGADNLEVDIYFDNRYLGV
ncbi:MAG TPA: phage tail family protein, partial [Lachnospiraceae bacterium]|nr:phage tail family protein [Lachnospiraceae bacterium]